MFVRGVMWPSQHQPPAMFLALSSFLVGKLALDIPSDLLQAAIDYPAEMKTVKHDITLIIVFRCSSDVW
jgi:hypothetical protein